MSHYLCFTVVMAVALKCVVAGVHATGYAALGCGAFAGVLAALALDILRDILRDILEVRRGSS